MTILSIQSLLFVTYRNHIFKIQNLLWVIYPDNIFYDIDERTYFSFRDSFSRSFSNFYYTVQLWNSYADRDFVRSISDFLRYLGYSDLRNPFEINLTRYLNIELHNSFEGRFPKEINSKDTVEWHAVLSEHRLIRSDIDGNGYEDLIFIDARNGDIAVKVGFYGISGFLNPVQLLSFKNSSQQQLQFADVNGDRKVDALYFDTNSTKENERPRRKRRGMDPQGIQVFLSTGREFSEPKNWLELSDANPDQIRFSDVNGDGKADALFFETQRNSDIWVSLSTGTRFAKPVRWLRHGPSVPSQIQYADVDGDGKADALYFDTYRSGGVWVGLSTGSKFTKPQQWVQFGHSYPWQVQYADLDDDGKADLIYNAGGLGVSICLSLGNRFSNPTSWLEQVSRLPNQIDYTDINGDGVIDSPDF
jgi:hypothetical protein